MSKSPFPGRNTPCNGCPDRHEACWGHCQKPDYLAWRKELETIRNNRKNYICPIWTHGDSDPRK